MKEYTYICNVQYVQCTYIGIYRILYSLYIDRALKKSVFAQPVASTLLFDKYVLYVSIDFNFFFTGIKSGLSTVRIIDALLNLESGINEISQQEKKFTKLCLNYIYIIKENTNHFITLVLHFTILLSDTNKKILLFFN